MMETTFLEPAADCTYCTAHKNHWAASIYTGRPVGPDEIANVWWESCMEQRDFQHLWTTDEDGEHEKYEKIRARLTADDKIREQREKEIIQQCAHWADRLRSQATRLTGERDDLKLLFDTITKVQFNWASNMQADSGQAAYLSNLDYHRDHGQLFRLKRVVIPGCDNTTAKELAVTTTLSHSRYYLGHQGGDYIFRYRDRHDAGLDDPLNMRSMLENEPTWPSDIWNNPHWLSQFLTDDSELEMMNRFTYCGQVPRPQKEYMARLETLYPDVIAIASSIIHFLAETQGKCPCSLYQRLPPADLGRLAIAFLQRLWVYCMHDDRDRMVLHVQSKAKNNPKILEFAFVVARVAAVHRRILIEMGPLLTVLEAATGLTLFEMINQYDLRAAEIAHQELFRTGDFTHFMVFEDDSIDVSEMPAVSGWLLLTVECRVYLNPTTQHQPDRVLGDGTEC